MVDYPKPSVTADIVVIRNGNILDRSILMIRRRNDPFKGKFALPGGFVDPGETVVQSAIRELKEETGLSFPQSRFRLVGVYSDPGRDPRGWTISTCFVVKASPREVETITAGDDAESVVWKEYMDLVHGNPARIAFDHLQMVADGENLARF